MAVVLDGSRIWVECCWWLFFGSVRVQGMSRMDFQEAIAGGEDETMDDWILCALVYPSCNSWWWVLSGSRIWVECPRLLGSLGSECRAGVEWIGFQDAIAWGEDRNIYYMGDCILFLHLFLFLVICGCGIGCDSSFGFNFRGWSVWLG